ncbi:MAG TPA: NAD(P)-binding domain-containing protein, partial [Desulfomonilia bacterium]|nr:NAD(P)-binding domain-containing protein [Desulfomonilia bacterium]
MERDRIGWIGTGVMGAPMCAHLMGAGHEVHVYTRTKSKASRLVDQGAGWCESPGEAAHGAEFVFTMVGYPADVEEVYFSGSGILE